MIYPPRVSKRRKKRTLVTLLFFAFLIVVVFVLNFAAPHLFSPLMQFLSKPFHSSGALISDNLGSVGEITRSRSSLLNENQFLKDKLVLYDAIALERNILQKENEELRGIASSTAPKTVIGKVISKPGYSPYDTMVVDVGANDGVEKGDMVLANGTLVLGEISVVFSHTATVALYSSPDKKLDVVIGDGAIEASAIGKGGGNYELKLPRNTSLREGDAVVLANRRNGLLGKVDVIETAPSDTFEKIYFSIPADINELKFVRIQKP